MSFQISFVLLFFFHSSLGQAQKGVCPKASLCKGCCAKGSYFKAQCAEISDETECGKQIACDWSDGPASGSVYNAFDNFVNGDQNLYSCYESGNLTSLKAFMAALKDDPHKAQHHYGGFPMEGTCADCYSLFGRKTNWQKRGIAAPGIIAYTNPTYADVTESSLNTSERTAAFHKTVTVKGVPGCVQADVSSSTAKLFGGKPGTCADEGCSTPTGSQHIPGCCTVQGFSCARQQDVMV